jgi:hypothetical protein
LQADPAQADPAPANPPTPERVAAYPLPTYRASTNGSGPAELTPLSWSAATGYLDGRASSDHRVLRGIRSAVALATIALALAVAFAATMSLLIWAIAAAIHHAAAN